MLPPKKNILGLSSDAYKRWVEWKTLGLAKKIFVISFIYINILTLVLNFKIIGDYFYPAFIKNINMVWIGIWGLAGGVKLFDYIFPKKTK